MWSTIDCFAESWYCVLMFLSTFNKHSHFINGYFSRHTCLQCSENCKWNDLHQSQLVSGCSGVVHITVNLAWIMTVRYLQQGNIFVFPQLLSEQSEWKQTNEILISIYQVKAPAQILTFNLERPFGSRWMLVLWLPLVVKKKSCKNKAVWGQQCRSHREQSNKMAIWV